MNIKIFFWHDPNLEEKQFALKEKLKKKKRLLQDSENESKVYYNLSALCPITNTRTQKLNKEISQKDDQISKLTRQLSDTADSLNALKSTLLPYVENSWIFIDARAQAARSTQAVQKPTTVVQPTTAGQPDYIALAQQKTAELASFSAFLSAQEKVKRQVDQQFLPKDQQLLAEKKKLEEARKALEVERKQIQDKQSRDALLHPAARAPVQAAAVRAPVREEDHGAMSASDFVQLLKQLEQEKRLDGI